MAHPPTDHAAPLAEQVVAPAADQGFFEAAWAILGSGTSALAGWLAEHGWGVIGLGIMAIVVTFLATELFKAVLDVARSENRKKPIEMADDMHRLIVRVASFANGVWVASAFGFGDQVGAAIGIPFDWFSAGVVGGLMNSGASAGAFYFWKWSWGPSDGAKRFRAVLRIKSSKFLRVSEEEIDAAATQKQSPAQMAELRKTLAEDDSDD